MGYDIHITRAADWSHNSGQEIRPSEWRAVVREDPELVEDPDVGAHAVIWRREKGGDGGWFDWVDGNVYTTDASPDALRKMVELASRLEARVQGDDGEFYQYDGQQVVRAPS
jgi:hypothetical protein